MQQLPRLHCLELTCGKYEGDVQGPNLSALGQFSRLTQLRELQVNCRVLPLMALPPGLTVQNCQTLQQRATAAGQHNCWHRISLLTIFS